MIQRSYLRIFSIWLLIHCGGYSSAQPGASVSDLEKPKKFENRKLASEKDTDKKIGGLRRFTQNVTSHYNYQFNAYNELNDVVTSAKQSYKDDFSKLLSFYNYSLQDTKGQKAELDSVIHKTNNGILLHDLRSDWVDDMYMLMGLSYFYQDNLDSAAIVFQYINFAFQPRTKDELGYDKKIGSNMNATGNVYTISTKEKNNVFANTFKNKPKRNDALLWYVRTMIEKGNYNESWGLLETLRRDVQFPSRLKPDLEELEALWFYKQEIYDSAAFHLEEALDNAESNTEKSRWEYLIAQMYERSGKKDMAEDWYARSMKHTTDPIMEAWARISQIRLVTGENEELRIKENLAALNSMAKKSRYEEYRYMIFYAAAQMEMLRHQPDAAVAYLRKSINENLVDDAHKQRSFLLMAELNYSMKKWGPAYAAYDSVNLDQPDIPDGAMLAHRKSILGEVVKLQENIRVEDSLQHIARMPEEERKKYVKVLAKKLRKERGLKEEEAAPVTGTAAVPSAFDANVPADIFAENAGRGGEWYFSNSSLRSQGYRMFKGKWGNRPNVDNWRRITAINTQAIAINTREDGDAKPNAKTVPDDITSEGLMENIPLTPEALKVSNDTLESSYYQLGKIFKDRLDDCDETIINYENLLNKFPETNKQEEALFGLYSCYAKAGNTAKANFYKGFLEKNFSSGKYLRYINSPVQAKKDENAFNTAATKSYEDVYNSFIEGKFDQALEAKKKADSTYGENYWTPQLLYIESVYYIKNRQDSLAMSTLNNLIRLYPQSNLIMKAGNLLNVLSRRGEIEDYLTNLQVTRMKEDSIYQVEDLYIPKEKQQITQAPKPQAEVAAPPKTIVKQVDTTQFKAPEITKKAAGYSFNAAEPQKVALVLDKVDIVYVNEARQALNRYNREKYYSTPLEISIKPLNDDVKLVIIDSFPDAGAAVNYLENTRKVAQAEIFPWLPAGKWKFILLSGTNLDVLQEKKNVDEYIKFLQQAIPGKF
ncbi:hypothetical protein [Pollutibacter soli]|uniref:type IX secretion system periplasmic lipoprotein PorW/SprE n=1 Tax=Pollutibacter soli TaxID=3034157 RepID=UPI0030133CA4